MADMNEKIEVAAKALYAHEFGRGLCEFPAWDHETTRENLRERFRERARAVLAALPPLQAREEIAQATDDLSERIRAKMQEPAFRELGERLDANINWPRYLPIQKVRPTAVSDWLVRLSSGREIGLTNDEWESALSCTAGQEWREPADNQTTDELWKDSVGL